MKRRLYFTVLALAIVLLAIGGWVVEAARPKGKLSWLRQHRLARHKVAA